MPGRPFRAILCAALLLAGPAARAAAPFLLGGEERLLILAPHPDDETLATGGLIQEALALDIPVRLCFFTMGDNNEIAFLFTRKHPVLMPGAVRSMGTLRQNEALAAATQLGLSTNEIVFLGYPDYGTLAIWNRHWRTVPPFRSMLTRATAVPYPRALTPGSAYAGEDILDDLEEVLRDFRPTHVFVSHPADHNVDHRALYLFTRVALWDLESEDIRPEILPGPVHFTQWPEPRRYHPLSPAFPPHFLDQQIAWREFSLAPFQVTNKLAALRRHHSQYLYSAPYLDSFVRKSELFGDFPILRLPGGSGTAALAEEDDSQFRTDEDLFRELARQSDQWTAIAEQNEAETADLNDHDNDFIERNIAGDGTNLVLTFTFQRPVLLPAVLTVAVFGYRAGTPFGEMPKIAIEATPDKLVSVMDLDEKLPADAVGLEAAAGDEIVLRIPYALLGDPDRILVGARLLKGSLPVDWAAWRVIDLGRAPAAEPAPAAPTEAPAVAPPPPESKPPEARPPEEKPKPAKEKPAKAKPPKAKPRPEPPAPPRPEPPAPPRPEPEAAPPAAPADEPAVEAAPAKPVSLVPRVNLPRKPVPEATEANEPVLW